MSDSVMKLAAMFAPENCRDCAFHRIENDPDPDDWFCSDDVKVVCTKANKNITVACRPYRTRQESNRPMWCPIVAALVGAKP